MSSGKSTMSQQVMTCPACQQPIHATFSTDVQVDTAIANLAERAVNATLTVTGMRVDHNCIPQATRSQWEAIGR